MNTKACPPDPATALCLSVEHDLGALDPGAWDALDPTGNPFVSYAWLRALEVTGCVGPGTGWSPHYVVARVAGELVGAVPLFLKAHSYGEYVYDWAWADLASRLDKPYYPKVISASPFSPCTGPRVLVSPALAPSVREAVFDALVRTSRSLAEQEGLTGLHMLFVDEPVAKRLGERGFIVRTAHQYHWANEGYADFDAFLARFRSKRRREIRRERRRVAEGGYTVSAHVGDELTAEERDDIFRYYRTTCARYVWGRQYLSRAFFDEVCARMGAKVRVFFARDASGARVAGTFNLVSPTRMYGRYWGADVEVPHLHFETCYYAMIEYAIAHGYEAIEPGAGGDHKYARGFAPVTTYSAHTLNDPLLRHLLTQHLERERDAISCMVNEMQERGPLRPIEVPEASSMD